MPNKISINFVSDYYIYNDYLSISKIDDVWKEPKPVK